VYKLTLVAFFGIEELSYTERLQKLGFWSREARRIRSDLIEVYRMIYGLSTVNFEWAH